MATAANTLYDLIRLVRPLYKTLESAVARALQPIGLTVTERAVLEQLHDNGPTPVPRIADALLAPRQFIQKTANGLIEAGLVERRSNTAHRRSSLMALTDAGKSEIAEILKREAGITASVAAELSAADVATAQQVIRTIINGFKEKEHTDG